MSVLTKLKRHATRLKRGNARIKPGQPFRLNEACSVGDGVWQGDLGVEIVAEIPPEYIVRRHGDDFRQLVPGNTSGARHCLDKDIVQYIPEGWGENYTGLKGPAFTAQEETRILHPTHGDVVISAGHIIATRYQRNLDEDTRRERRALD